MRGDWECQRWNRFCIGIDYLFIYDSLLFVSSITSFLSSSNSPKHSNYYEKPIDGLLFTIHFYVSISFLFWFRYCMLSYKMHVSSASFSIALMYVHECIVYMHKHRDRERERTTDTFWENISTILFRIIFEHRFVFSTCLRWNMRWSLSTSICFIISTSSSWTHLELKSIKQVEWMKIWKEWIA